MENQVQEKEQDILTLNYSISLKKKVRVEYCPTDEMLADYMTK